jgi:hypothetical protein
MISLLAHQGGWDEFVYFLIPAVLAIFAVRWAERRARRRAEDAKSEAGDLPTD